MDSSTLRGQGVMTCRRSTASVAVASRTVAAGALVDGRGARKRSSAPDFNRYSAVADVLGAVELLADERDFGLAELELQHYVVGEVDSSGTRKYPVSNTTPFICTKSASRIASAKVSQ